MSAFKGIDASWYGDSPAYDKAVRELSHVPALVSFESILRLRERLRDPRAIFLQKGPCAETFDERFRAQPLQDQANAALVNTTLISRLCLVYRMAGQFAKSRSSRFEEDGRLSYSGDLLHRVLERTADPTRMKMAYEIACERLPEQANTFVSHEFAHVGYESALRRAHGSAFAIGSCHMPWLGARAVGTDGPLLGLLQNTISPIGIKVAPWHSNDELQACIEAIQPKRESGKLVLITRYHAKDEALLQARLERFAHCDARWLVDPMHGQTECVEGRKLRTVEQILAGLEMTIRVHKKVGVPLSGLHLECTSNAKQECSWNASDDTKLDEPICDPQLNPAQTLAVEQAFYRGILAA